MSHRKHESVRETIKETLCISRPTEIIPLLDDTEGETVYVGCPLHCCV